MLQPVKRHASSAEAGAFLGSMSSVQEANLVRDLGSYPEMTKEQKVRAGTEEKQNTVNQSFFCSIVLLYMYHLCVGVFFFFHGLG